VHRAYPRLPTWTRQQTTPALARPRVQIDPTAYGQVAQDRAGVMPGPTPSGCGPPPAQRSGHTERVVGSTGGVVPVASKPVAVSGHLESRSQLGGPHPNMPSSFANAGVTQPHPSRPGGSCVLKATRTRMLVKPRASGRVCRPLQRPPPTPRLGAGVATRAQRARCPGAAWEGRTTSRLGGLIHEYAQVA
jgi:hypothetical protein